jgi:hypothetical protein
MPDRTAPYVFVSYAHDSPRHWDHVREFTHYLCARHGVDAHLDQWDDHWRVDWSAWALDHLTRADFILVIASPDYKRRAEGAAPPDEGRGSQFEAMIIRDNLTKDMRRETKRILPVVLPGGSVEDIPTFLAPYSTTRFEISEFTDAGVSGLLAAMTGRSRHPRPELGEWLDGAANIQVQVPLAVGLPWTVYSHSVRPGSAMINGVHYDDSIVLRPATPTVETISFVEVELDGRYERMTAVVGVLDDARETFQVGHFRVCLDGRPQAEQRAALGKPRPIDLSVGGARKIRLEMYRPASVTASAPAWTQTAGGRSWSQPELAWGNPMLS